MRAEIKEKIAVLREFKIPKQVNIIATVILVVLFMVVFFINKSSGDNPNNWEIYSFPYDNSNDPDNASNADIKVSFDTDAGTYSPSVDVINAKLVNTAIPGKLSCGRYFRLVRELGDEWRVVPFKDDVGFDDIAILLGISQSETYNVSRDMFAVDLIFGDYRIVTDVWYGEESRETLTVWAEFRINET